MSDFVVGNDSVGGGKLDGVFDVDGAAAVANDAHGVVHAALDVVAHFEVVLLELDLLLYHGVRVVDDGKKHVLTKTKMQHRFYIISMYF